jgi:hypothetical protein
MKKLIFLSLFLFGAFVAVQAQVDYKISNQTAASWTYTATVGASSASATVASGNLDIGTFPDFVEPVFAWTATDGTCTLNGVIAAAPAGGSFTCPGGSTMDFYFNQVGVGPGGAAIYELVVKLN